MKKKVYEKHKRLINSKIMYKRYLLALLLITGTLGIQAQDISDFLQQVSRNNPEILAYQKLLEARRIEAKTGLTPSDPVISFGIWPGNSAAIGSKKIWSVNQSFAFPTKYLIQKRVNISTLILAEQEFNFGKLMTLLNAKLLFIDLVYSEKTLNILLERKKGYDNLLDSWKKMVSYGEATILEYNKIAMELSSLTLNINKREAQIKTLSNKLQYLAGNNASLPELFNYPLTEEQDFEELITYKTEFHPSFIIPQKEYLLSVEEIKLTKTGSLPEFQIGVGSEIVMGEAYTGPVAGFSVPLWSNLNKVKTASAISDQTAAARDAELLRLKSEVMIEFLNMDAIKKSMLDISDILKTGENKKYLDIALGSGEISLTTYFSDLGVMHEIEDRFYELEYEYNKSLARLYDTELLK